MQRTSLSSVLAVSAVLLFLAGTSGAVRADDAPFLPRWSEDLVAALETLWPQSTVTDITRTPVRNVAAAALADGRIIHGTLDGRYLIQGDLLELAADGGVKNLTEGVRTDRRLAAMSGADLSGGVEFSAHHGERAHLIVFTDYTCPYCQQFHDEVELLNAIGVRVSYYAFPRAGVDSDVARRMAGAWCAQDPQGALTRLKRDASSTSPGAPEDECQALVTRHYELGRSLGVQATPAVIDASSGALLGGAVGFRALARALGIIGVQTPAS